MRVANFVSTALLMLSELSPISAKPIFQAPQGLNQNGLDAIMDKEARDTIRRVERRQSSTGTLQPSDGNMNSTISSACVASLSQMSAPTNEAGILACYNILQNDTTSNTFQADLRLYQTQEPSGQFSGVAAQSMLVNLVYPPSTSFMLLKTKRSVTKIQSGSMTELQQYSLQGSFSPGMEMSKLNQSEIMSLMVPMIKINAVEPNTQKAISTNLTSTDTAYFIVGEFTKSFSESLVNPTFQAAAIAASSPFVIPGRTFGIFPTGLIVTMVWVVLFVAAYGLGTLGRLQHRAAYRRRQEAMSGRTGKKIIM